MTHRPAGHELAVPCAMVGRDSRELDMNIQDLTGHLSGVTICSIANDISRAMDSNKLVPTHEVHADLKKTFEFLCDQYVGRGQDLIDIHCPETL